MGNLRGHVGGASLLAAPVKLQVHRVSRRPNWSRQSVIVVGCWLALVEVHLTFRCWLFGRALRRALTCGVNTTGLRLLRLAGWTY